MRKAVATVPAAGSTLCSAALISWACGPIRAPRSVSGSSACGWSMRTAATVALAAKPRCAGSGSCSLSWSASSVSSGSRSTHESRAGWTRSPGLSSCGVRPELSRPFRKPFSQPVDDALERRARGEELGHALLLQRGDVVVGDDAAAEDHDVGGLAPFQLLNDGGKQSHVRARMDGQADDLRVLLQGRVDDHLGRLAEPRVDHLVARLA